MHKLDYCIGTHNVTDVSGSNITDTHANLYLIKNRYYEVDYRSLSTSGGVLSTC